MCGDKVNPTYKNENVRYEVYYYTTKGLLIEFY